MPQSPTNTLVAQGPSGFYVPLKCNAEGELIVADSSGSADPVTTTPKGGTAHNYAANSAGAQVKTGAGVVLGLSVNTPGLTSSLVLYDGTSTAGTKLGTFSTLAQVSLTLNIAFTTGLFAVLAGGTPADVTIVNT
jgi:hypothetical protein